MTEVMPFDETFSGFRRLGRGDVDEEPLAAGFYEGDGLAGEGGLVIDLRERDEAGVEVDDWLACKGAVESAGGAVDCVAFGHKAGVRDQGSVKQVSCGNDRQERQKLLPKTKIKVGPSLCSG